ncbi:B12-binding domain-containing radical SAM protein [uncultured Desulfobacter sp.]|uniref:B12-binding domain-containing radical SAM protein n=1 Tax=uncultured Desulfobacter sp. TaxID=240139 RepID=UPI002AAB525E|nr:radical SAM protein [uncultured Desulfobacter sp.]
MADIVLIAPPIREFYLTKKRTIPYGLACIATQLEQAGFSCTIIDALARDKSKIIEYPEHFDHLIPHYGRTDLTFFSLFHHYRHFGYSFEHIANLVRQEKPFLVGISALFTPYFRQALDTARAVKLFWPNAFIVLGGHHATQFPSHCLENKEIDFLIQGEGEAPMVQLARVLKGRAPGTLPHPDDLIQISGIGFRQGHEIVLNPPSWADCPHGLDQTAMDKIDWHFYQRNKKAAITIVASRGCPFSCSYCAVSSSSNYAGFRMRPVKDVLDEITLQAKSKQIGFIDFEDENLTLKKSWVLELLGGIRQIFKGQETELRAMNGLFPPSLDKEILTAMKETGFKTLNLSVGSFSATQLKRFKRPDVREAHDRVLDMARELDMDCVSYLLGAAPGQTADTTLNDLLTLAAKRTIAGLSIYYPAPGSSDYALCERQRLLPHDFSLSRSTAFPVVDTTSRLEAVTLLRLARILNFLKAYVDQHGVLPKSLRANHISEIENSCHGELDRYKASILLIRMFLSDAVPRGMDYEGRIYHHPHSRELCKKFVQGLVQPPAAV